MKPHTRPQRHGRDHGIQHELARACDRLYAPPEDPAAWPYGYELSDALVLLVEVEGPVGVEVVVGTRETSMWIACLGLDRADPSPGRGSPCRVAARHRAGCR